MFNFLPCQLLLVEPKVMGWLLNWPVVSCVDVVVDKICLLNLTISDCKDVLIDGYRLGEYDFLAGWQVHVSLQGSAGAQASAGAI